MRPFVKATKELEWDKARLSQVFRLFHQLKIKYSKIINPELYLMEEKRKFLRRRVFIFCAKNQIFFIGSVINPRKFKKFSFNSKSLKDWRRLLNKEVRSSFI